MTIPRFNALAEYWVKTPPLAEMVAAVFGYSKTANKLGEQDAAGSMDSMIAEFGGAGLQVKINKKA